MTDEKSNDAETASRLSAFAGYGLGKAVPGVLTFLAVPALVRAVGPGGYAVFALSWALTLLTGAIGTGWLRTAMLRFAGDTQKGLRALPKALIASAICAPAAAASAGMAWLSTGSVFSVATIEVLALTLVFAGTSNVYSILLSRAQRDVKSTRFALAESCRVLVSVLASLALAAVSGLSPAANLIAGHAVGTLVGGSILAEASTVRQTSDASDCEDVLRAYWNYGWPMSLWLAAAAGLLYGDRFVASAFLEADQLGIYFAVADGIVRGFAMVASPIVMLAHPVIMRAVNASRWEDARSALKSASRTMIATMTIAVGVVIGAAPPLLRLLFDGESPNRGTLCLIALGASLWQVALLAHKPLEMVNRTLMMTCFIVVAAAVSAGTSAVLVPEFGATGAATGFSLGACIYVLACLLAGRAIGRDGKQSPRKYFRATVGKDEP